MNNKKYITILILLLSITTAIDSALSEKNFKWMKISGNWEAVKADDGCFHLTESKAKTYPFGYRELINLNSIITLNPVGQYSKITFTLEAENPVDDPVEMMFFFAAKDFRNFYAFRFRGNSEKLNTLRFIRSKDKDTSLPRKVKWNFIIEEIASKDYALDYRKKHRFEIRFAGRWVQLRINGRKVLSTSTDNPLNSGKIGFSNRNATLKIADLKVYNGRRIVFRDDFSEDTIKRYGVRVKRKKD